MKKVTLQDKIEEIRDYFSNIEIRDNLYIVKIYYPDKWKAYNSSDGLISVADGNGGLWLYYANVGDVELYDIFDLVKDTIKTNQENVIRIALMKEKMLELKDVFSNSKNSLEALQGLKFVLGTDNSMKPKRNYKKKTTKKKEEENNIEQKEIEE